MRKILILLTLIITINSCTSETESDNKKSDKYMSCGMYMIRSINDTIIIISPSNSTNQLPIVIDLKNFESIQGTNKIK